MKKAFFCLAVIFLALGSALATQRNVQTFGALGNGTHDDTSAINSAIAAMASGDELYFPCPSSFYLIASALTTINVQNATIDGQTGCGNGRVMIKETGSGAYIMKVGSGNTTSYTPLTADSTELGTTFTANLSAIGGLVTGNYVVMQMSGVDNSNVGGGDDHTCDISGCRGEVLKILSVSGNTVTVTTALHYPYDQYHTQQTERTDLGVAKLTSLIDNAYVHDLIFDGSGTVSIGLQLNGVTNSTVTNVTGQNVGNWALHSAYAYNLAWNNIAINNAGNGGADAMDIRQQGHPSITTATLSNLRSGSEAFGLGIETEADGTFTGVSIDAAGTSSGRPLKPLAASYNTWNSLTVKNGQAGYNNMSLEYYSSHNTFNNCVIQNAVGNGIVGFGNYNQYNTFNNCTVSGNTGYQLSSGKDATGSYADAHWEINGGTWTGTSGQYAIQGTGVGWYVHNATIQGASGGGAVAGLVVANTIGNTNNWCVNSNSFSRFQTNLDISEGGTGNLFNSNTTPDGVTPGSLPTGTCASATASSPNPPTGLTATAQ